jgi:hypothetical protein
VEKAENYFETFLNAKMVNPVSRSLLKSFLQKHEFYANQVKEIYDNRGRFSEVLVSYFSKYDIVSFPKNDVTQTHGNFFSLAFTNPLELPVAIALLQKSGLLIRHKSHWDFIRITSVNNNTLLRVLEMLK